MEIQENQTNDWLSDTESTGSTSRRTLYSGQLSGPLVATTKTAKKSARFKDEEDYVEITLDVRDDSVLVQNIRGAGAGAGDSDSAAFQLAAQLERRQLPKSSSLGSQLSFKLKQVSQELKRMTSSKKLQKIDRNKSAAARALVGLKFMNKSNVGGAGGEGWAEVESRFHQLADADGTLPDSRFGQCIGR